MKGVKWSRIELSVFFHSSQIHQLLRNLSVPVPSGYKSNMREMLIIKIPKSKCESNKSTDQRFERIFIYSIRQSKVIWFLFWNYRNFKQNCWNYNWKKFITSLLPVCDCNAKKYFLNFWSLNAEMIFKTSYIGMRRRQIYVFLKRTLIVQNLVKPRGHLEMTLQSRSV